ncbi:MAG: glycosyltransferase family 2 protein, partial [Magnetospirillum sp.]|nr:glycosyltransferase family 2 protein [Magnetospirillum sp.]
MLVLSVVIKAFNEEKNIAACIRSVIAATSAWNTEIIVADSCSQDRTVEMASALPVTVVRLANSAERSCGAGGQLGYQFARGKYLLMLDGDMELVPGFLEEAMAMLETHPRLAGVGGLLEERSQTLEFIQRSARPDSSYNLGEVQHLNSGGLYRVEAIRDVGYFTNRNLHSREEFELGLRLRTSGWTLARIGTVAVHHHGHTISSWRLLKIRWRSKYFHGYGELLRSAFGQPHFLPALWTSLLFMAVVLWWGALLAVTVMRVVTGDQAFVLAALALLIFPLAVLLVRKRNLAVAVYSMV